jgi:hypothetical protein
MRRKSKNEQPFDRNEVIAQVQDGQITREQAETEAAKHGAQPFEWRPPLPAYDPMQEAYWSLVMSVAWIAWRDLSRVREQDAGFRSECTHWLFREWKRPGETTVRSGWFLEPWSKTSVVSLRLLGMIMESRGTLPPTGGMSVKAAQQELWRALSEGRLRGYALNTEGVPVDIPEKEWAYLQLYEEREADVLKYNPLDSRPAFTQVKMKRDDLFKSWPPITHHPVELTDNFLIDAKMIAPVASSGSAGFVPLCSALHWIMTKGGLLTVTLDAEPEWQSACNKLFPLIHEGKIDLFGLEEGSSLNAKIPGHSLALVEILRPLKFAPEMIFPDAPPHISCNPYIDQEHWKGGFSDELFLKDGRTAAWTHLQVSKRQILELWPRPPSQAKAARDCYSWLLQEMQQSPSTRPKSKGAFRQEALAKFKGLTGRQFDQTWAMAALQSGAAWSTSGRPKSNQNAH